MWKRKPLIEERPGTSLWRLALPILASLLVLTLLLATPACVEEETVQSEPLPIPVVEIDGKAVYAEEFDAFREMEEGEEDTAGLERRLALDNFIIQKVLQLVAEREGIVVSPVEAKAVTADWLPGETDSDPVFLEQVAAYLTVQKFLRTKLAAQEEVELIEMRDYYVRHSDEFVVEERFLVLEILVADRQFADQLAEQLQPGDFRSFRELAKAHSIGSTAAQGGELGVFSRGELPEKFEDVISKLRVGEISQVFRSESGFHLFVVEEKTPKHAKRFYEVQRDIFDRLVAEKERQALLDYLPEVLDGIEVYVYENGVRKRWRLADVS